MAKGLPGETLISFESGHYKKVNGKWAGDSVWSHFVKKSGGVVHINKDKCEYIETFEDNNDDCNCGSCVSKETKKKGIE